MPKPRTPRQNAAYRKLQGRLTRYGLQLRALFDAFSDDVAKLVAGTGYSADSDKPFRFKDYPAVERKFKRLKEKLAKDMHALIGRTTAAEVENADKISDELAKSVIRAYGGNASNPAFSPYFVHRSAAVEAFLARRRDGQHGWSKRVWDIAETNGKELELAVSAAIKDGKAATKLATEIKKYLNEPDRLFRRVRNEFGQLVLSRNAKLYHPGRGIYRSSYKNALRLAATETNVAYRQAENERWKAMDFIVGVEIHLSKSHKVEDICDELQGKYPVAFGTTWTGWHPNCLCYKTSILKTEEEFWDMDQSKPSKNEVKDMQEGWYRWAANNADRIKAAAAQGKEPWFIRDNKAVWDETLAGLKYPENFEAYRRLKADENYTEVAFDKKSGGVMARHIRHNEPNGSFNFNGDSVSSANLERECQKELSNLGYKAILRPEGVLGPDRKELPSLDMELDGTPIDIRSVVADSQSFRNQIKSKSGQLKRFLSVEPESGADSVCLYFHSPEMFSGEKVKRGIQEFLKTPQAEGTPLKRVICVVRGADRIYEYWV